MTVSIEMTVCAKKALLSTQGARLRRVHKTGLRKALNETGKDVVDDIVRFIMSPPKTGRIYYFRGRPHQASAPGESPANRTGRLARSASYRTRNHQEMTVGEVAPYAGYLEYGTVKMDPRPHIVRAVNKNHRNMVRSIEHNVKEQVGSG